MVLTAFAPRADKESEISTLEHYLYMNKTSEQKPKEV